MATDGTPAPASAWAGLIGPGWIGPGMVVAGVLLYLRALGYPLLGIDDQGYYGNPALAGGDWRGLAAVWSGFYRSDYFPLTQWTWWLDLRCGDGGGHWVCARLQSGAWLGVGAWGVWAAMRRVLSQVPGGARIALGIAVLYLVHPLCAPAVLWLAERKNLVALAFAWWAVERYAAWRQGGGAGCAAWSCALVAAALLAKPHAVAVPAMMGAVEIAVGAGPWWRRALMVAPAGAMAALFTGVDLGARHDLVLAPLGGSRAASMWCDGPILARYIGQVLWPADLTIYYPVIEDPGRVVAIGSGWAIVVAAVAASVAMARGIRRRLVVCGWAVAAAGLAPALNIVPQAAPATDHYVQWALPGVLLVAAMVVVEGWERLRVRRVDLAGVGFACVVAGLAAATVMRAGDFRTRDEFFLRAYAKQPAAAINIAGFVDVLAQQRGLYDPSVGALALAALRAEDHARMLGFAAPPVIVAGGVECWRREGRAAAQAAVAEFIRGDDPELGLLLWCEILVGVGKDDEADGLISARLGPDFMAAAAEVARRCRGGAPLPDRMAPLYRPPLRALSEEDSDARALVDVLRLGLLLAQIRAAEGKNDDGFGLAGLCLNIDPGNADARGMVGRLYAGPLQRPDLAAALGQ